VYLATIIDLTTRMIVGWSMVTHIRTELVESALRSALTWRAPAEKLVHHSDRGSQYASASYRAMLDQHGIECSMSRAEDC
jgi:putative transposase